MIKRFFIDIETLPPEEEMRHSITGVVKHKLENEGGQANNEQVAELTDKQFREMALHGEHGRVLAIGMIVECDMEVVHRGLLGRDRITGRFHLDEARTLRSFWKLLRDFDLRR